MKEVRENMKTDQNFESVQQKHSSERRAELPSDSSNLFVLRRVDESASARESVQRPSITYFQDAWIRLKKNKIAIVAAVYIIVLALAAICVPPFLEFKYDEQEVWNALSKPSLGQSAFIASEEEIKYEELSTTLPAEQNVFAPPASPSNVRILGEPLTLGMNVGWDKVDGAKTYKLYRSIKLGTLGVPVSELPANKLSFVDHSALVAGQVYHYTVIAVNPFGDSEPSQEVAVTPKLALPLHEAIKINPNAKPGETITTKSHFLGTDYLGRDTLARLLVGARISLFIGFVAPLLYVFVGLIFGAISGFFGGMIDNIMMRIADLITTVPELLVLIMLQVVMGSGPVTLIVAMVVSLWARIAISIRGEVLRIREMEYVQSAKVLGTPTRKIISKHVLPNVMGSLIVLFSLSIPQAIFTEAFLSFIGLGIAPPMPSWGTITREGAKVFLTYPMQLLFPAVMMSLTMLAFNLLGDGLRDALDPKMRGAK